MVEDLKKCVIDGLVVVGLIYVYVLSFLILWCLIFVFEEMFFESLMVCEECKGFKVGVFEKVIEGFLCGVGFMMD